MSNMHTVHSNCLSPNHSTSEPVYQNYGENKDSFMAVPAVSEGFSSLPEGWKPAQENSEDWMMAEETSPKLKSWSCDDLLSEERGKEVRTRCESTGSLLHNGELETSQCCDVQESEDLRERTRHRSAS